MNIEEAIENNQGMVRLIAHKYNFGRVDFEDLVQAGNVGLLEAHKRFDEDRGVSFITYACPWIKKYVIECTNNSSVVHIPDEIKYTKIKIDRSNNKNRAKCNEDLTGEELTEMTKLTLKQVLDAIKIKQESEFNDFEVTNNEESALLDKITVKQLFSVLDEQEMSILIKRFCHEVTLQEIGDEIGRTRECVRLQINKILDKLLAKGKRLKR